MNHGSSDRCCVAFDPGLWDEKEVRWEGKRFVKERVRSILHVPVNFGAVMRRSVGRIEAAGAKPEPMIVLADENSPWGADVYIEVTKDVPGAGMASISGTFLAKVFEGPYRNIGKWVAEMQAFVQRRGKTVQGLYFYYPTCPRCAKKFGKNHVVLLART